MIYSPGRAQECCAVPGRKTHNSRRLNQGHRSELLCPIFKNHQQFLPANAGHLSPEFQASQCKPLSHVSQTVPTSQDTTQRCNTKRNSTLDVRRGKPCSVLSPCEEELVWRGVSPRCALFIVKSFIHRCSGIGSNVFSAQFPSIGAAPVP